MLATKEISKASEANMLEKINSKRPAEKKRQMLALAVLSVGMFGAALANAQPASEPADRVFLSGVVITMARQGEIVEAVAVRGGKIVAVGTSDEVRKRIGSATTVVDLAGKTLVPGFYAAHDHLPS